MRFDEIIYGPLEIITITIVVEFEGQYCWNFVVKRSRQFMWLWFHLRGPGGGGGGSPICGWSQVKIEFYVVCDRGQPQLPDAFTGSKNIVPSQRNRILKFQKYR